MKNQRTKYFLLPAIVTRMNVPCVELLYCSNTDEQKDNGTQFRLLIHNLVEIKCEQKINLGHIPAWAGRIEENKML
jgi:hypothetical protein